MTVLSQNTGFFRDSLAPGKGRIYVYRVAKFGLANQPEILFNGRSIGKAVPEGFLYIDAVPGSHTISATTEIRVDIAQGQVAYVRLNARLGVIGNRIEPELVHERTGREQIRDTKYIGE